jgi:DNA-binding CsgD family transcriptional regulator
MMAPMAPFGDVAPALDVCRAASAGASRDVVGALALEAVARIVPVTAAWWIVVDPAGGGPIVVPGGGDVDAALVAHVAGHPAIGVDGSGPAVHDGPAGGHAACVAVPAPAGRRGGLVLDRADPLTRAERTRLATVAPLLACALLAAEQARPAADDRLTSRENAVLRSVAAGMSDKQAARALGVSPRTVGKHLEHIYAKLGVGGRTEAVAHVWLGAAARPGEVR